MPASLLPLSPPEPTLTLTFTLTFSMRIILTLLGKDLANLRRNRAALVLTFVVPMVIIYIVGLVFGLGRRDSGPTGIPFAVVNQSDNPAAQKTGRRPAGGEILPRGHEIYQLRQKPPPAG